MPLELMSGFYKVQEDFQWTTSLSGLHSLESSSFHLLTLFLLPGKEKAKSHCHVYLALEENEMQGKPVFGIIGET